MFIYESLSVFFASTVAIAVGNHAYNFFQCRYDNSFFRIFVPLIISIAIGLFILMGIDTYIGRPNVYQIVSGDKTYIVNNYNNFGNINFKCQNDRVYLSDAIVTEIPKTKEMKSGVRYCNS